MSLTRCNLFKIYIKPQLRYSLRIFRMVVIYLKFTSNHNTIGLPLNSLFVVIYLKFTSNHNFGPVLRAADEL